MVAAFKGYESPLRHRKTMASCLGGTHAIWWTVEAASERGALEFLLSYVADRTPATRVREVTSHEPRRHARHDPVRSLTYRRQGPPGRINRAQLGPAR